MYEFLLNSIMKKPKAYAYLMGVKLVEEAPITKSVGVFLDELETKQVFDLLEDKNGKISQTENDMIVLELKKQLTC